MAHKEIQDKSPFFLYSLKECLVATVRDAPGLRHCLQRSNKHWIEFEQRVIDCCNRVLRPYAAASPAISARMLVMHGRGATMAAATMMGMERVAQQYVKGWTKGKDTVVKKQCSRRSVPYEAWKKADADERMRLVLSSVIPQPSPYFTTSLPKRYEEEQRKALATVKHHPVVYICSTCRSGYLVAFHLPGMRCEALGNVIDNTYHCPVCEHHPTLTKISLVGQIMHATNGIFAACRLCAMPIKYSERGLFCEDCTKHAQKKKAQLLSMTSRRCWHNHCKRKCVQELKVVPKNGIEDGQPWPRQYSCSVHEIMPPQCHAPIPCDRLRYLWWCQNKG